jgi:hypothetical protein
MYSNSATKLIIDEFNNSGTFFNIHDTSSMPDSIANQIMNRAFVIIMPRVVNQLDYDLSPCDYDKLQTLIDTPPAPNHNLLELFKGFSTKQM